MPISVSISDSSGIPDEIRRAVLQLEPEFQGNWRASVISSQTNAHWELKLENVRGVVRRGKAEPGQQNPNGVQACMRKLRNEIEAER